MADEMGKAHAAPAELSIFDCHIRDEAFGDAALAVLDGWIAQGKVAMHAEYEQD